MKTFKSRKDTFFKVLIFGFNLIILLFIASEIYYDGWKMNYPLVILFALLSVFLWSIYARTNYRLDKNFLHYKSGPITGKIELKKITEIVINKTLWSGLKPATARNGLIIKYNKYDEIYISPFSNEEFVASIIKLNPEITITHNK
ncbi:MAG: PH domain-containing protein [Bacteroidota bacterium]